MYKRIINLMISALVIVLFSVSVSAEGNSEGNGISGKGSEKLLIMTVENTELLSYEGKDTGRAILSMKPSGGSMASRYIGISYRRTFSKDIESEAGSISFNGEKPSMKGFKSIEKELKKEYPNLNINDEKKPLGEILKKHGFRRGYFGNSSDFLILCDEKGEYDGGSRKLPNPSEIKSFLDSEFSKYDVILMSIDDKDEEAKYIESVLSQQYDSIIISKKFPQRGIMANKSLSTVLYKISGQGSGVLESESVKRKGLVSSLDIGSSVLAEMDITGKEIVKIGDYTDLNSDLIEYGNLTFSKYLYHGLTIAVSIVLILLYFFKRDRYLKLKRIIYLPILFIIYSIAFSWLSGHILIYNAAIILFSGLTFVKTSRYRICYFAVADILMLFGVFFAEDMLYNSFIGYNSIFAGGRYYGLNNDIMGALIAAGTATSFIIFSKLKDRPFMRNLSALWMAVHIFSLTGKFGNNFGGLLTSIAAFALFLAFYSLNGMKRKKTVLSAILILVAAAAALVVGRSSSHIALFFGRVERYGFSELFDMVRKKLGQLIYMTIMPPWCMVLISECVYIGKRIKEIMKSGEADPWGKLVKVIFISSIAALIFNDTGIVAFTYMNLFTMAAVEYRESVREACERS